MKHDLAMALLCELAYASAQAILVLHWAFAHAAPASNVKLAQSCLLRDA